MELTGITYTLRCGCQSDVCSDPVHRLISAVNDLKNLALVPVKQFVDCPLRDRRYVCNQSQEGNIELGHRDLSEILAGLGQYAWDCPFCGEKFED